MSADVWKINYRKLLTGAGKRSAFHPYRKHRRNRKRKGMSGHIRSKIKQQTYD